MVQNGSKPLPGPQRMLFDTLHAQNKFSNIFEKSKFRPQNPFFHAAQPYKGKKRDFKLISEPNLSLSFQDFVKRFQGSEVYDQIKLFVDRIFHTSIIFGKNRFFASLIAKILQKHAKILWKMLENFSKNVENFFSLKSLLMHSRWSRMVPNHSPDPRGCFSTLLHSQNKFPEIFEKSKFRPQNRFFHAAQLYKREKRVFSIIPEPNLSLSSQVFTKRFQGNEVYNQIKFFVC